MSTKLIAGRKKGAYGKVWDINGKKIFFNIEELGDQMKILVKFLPPYKNDDPTLCTAVRMINDGIAKLINDVPKGAIILYPFAQKVLSLKDKHDVERNGLVIVDCPWDKLYAIPTISSNSIKLRRLPNLIAANPYYKGQINKLSSAEAAASALYIIGYSIKAKKILSLFKWKEEFWKNNSEKLIQCGGK